MKALKNLKERLAELADLSAVQMLASWDQLVMMPADAGPIRAEQLGTLARIAHERATSDDIGEWLADLDGGELSELDSDIVRLARRDWERARVVPRNSPSSSPAPAPTGRRCGSAPARRTTTPRSVPPLTGT